ncbi:MAG: amidohydrolase family protein [Pseudomonadota bacterium]
MIGFDCHAHVFEDTAVVAGARYRPVSPAPLSEWLAHQRAHGLKGGVIVQVSFLGTDNTQLCAALSKLDRQLFCGVGVVPLDVEDKALDALVAAGIRGLRWNLVRGGDVPDMEAALTQTFFEKLRRRNLHLEVHLEGPRLAKLLGPLSAQGVAVVVDHFGLPSEPDPAADPMINAVRGLSDRSTLFFKFSGHYRSPFDLAPHAHALREALPSEHVVWGSDWPHTQYEARTSYGRTHKAIRDWGCWHDGPAVSLLYGVVET